jgi:hypothetical protein
MQLLLAVTLKKVFLKLLARCKMWVALAEGTRSSLFLLTAYERGLVGGYGGGSQKERFKKEQLELS